MSSQYLWAANPAKLQRAIAKSKHKTEEEIKELYIISGGLLNKVEEKLNYIENPPVVELTTDTEVLIPKKRMGRPKKNG